MVRSVVRRVERMEDNRGFQYMNIHDYADISFLWNCS